MRESRTIAGYTLTYLPSSLCSPGAALALLAALAATRLLFSLSIFSALSPDDDRRFIEEEENEGAAAADAVIAPWKMSFMAGSVLATPVSKSSL